MRDMSNPVEYIFPIIMLITILIPVIKLWDYEPEEGKLENK